MLSLDAPQLVGLFRSMQLIPQAVRLGEHCGACWHAPLLQVCPEGHALPHAPQFWSSVHRLEDILPHLVRPGEHSDQREN
jgi:hypothetical protein